jgi:hypothetical protein
MAAIIAALLMEAGGEAYLSIEQLMAASGLTLSITPIGELGVVHLYIKTRSDELVN